MFCNSWSCKKLILVFWFYQDLFIYVISGLQNLKILRYIVRKSFTPYRINKHSDFKITTWSWSPFSTIELNLWHHHQRTGIILKRDFSALKDEKCFSIFVLQVLQSCFFLLLFNIRVILIFNVLSSPEIFSVFCQTASVRIWWEHFLRVSLL